MGPLITFLGRGGPTLMGIPIQATVSQVFSNGSWSIAPPRSENSLRLAIYLASITLSDSEDEALWQVAGKEATQFSSTEVWKSVCHPFVSVYWANLIWHKHHIPKFAFTTWLVNLDRCPTRNRMISSGLHVDPRCLLCQGSEETRDHIFFSCPYSSGIIAGSLGKLIQIPARLSWNDLIASTQIILSRICKS
ncbi:PREDICTED: uncharacterized protein LOC104825290 [Tarenaya hassleriana]|uniref:uncharacterized protein LOC104825290 n=1 Tax=Tarenaya hassleriana TaxID=28532 RepID=UPI00053C87AA|nr:PREDICTED: uncharacterized protein LOC104825290 [Tarenaya hassleriana]